MYNSEILADLISQNEATAHSNEARMSEARYSSGYYYTESRKVCKICFL